jgi:HrpA-like RNA helicase
MASDEFGALGSREPAVLSEVGEPKAKDVAGKGTRPALPIFAILDSIDFSDHFVIIGDVGTGKSTVTPIHEFELGGRSRQIIIREPSRAACSALFYSLEALHPEIKHELAVITKDTKINVGGRIKIVTDGVLLRMLAEDSVFDSSIYFDESHQMSSQLELCLSLAKKEEARAGNLFRVMSATIDPKEFLAFLGISKLYSLSGRRYPVKIEVEMARDVDEMFKSLSLYLYTQPHDESWLVFLPTRRLVEKYASSYGGTYIHGGLEGSEINKIQARAEIDKNLRIFATNVIASSVNIYVDNVLIFNEVIDGKEKEGQKTLHYKKIDNNSLLQLIGRIGRFKPGRAVVISDTPIPKKIDPIPVRKALESETPFDLVLLMSKYGLKLSDLEFMSKVNHREVAFAEDWLIQIGAIDRGSHGITEKGLLMSEVPYDPDFAHMISSALIGGDYDMARFLLASGAFGDSLNHAWKTDMEGIARQLLYGLDKSSELNIKAVLLKRYSEDKEGTFVSRLIGHGIYLGFVEEAWKNYNAAREALNDLLLSSGREPIPAEVVVNPDAFKLRPYLEDCLSFDKFEEHEKREHNLHDMVIEGQFFARTLTINYRRILFDIVAMNSPRKHHNRHRR